MGSIGNIHSQYNLLNNGSEQLVNYSNVQLNRDENIIYEMYI